MVKTAAEKIGSAEFRKSAIDAMQKIVKDKSNTVIKKERTYRNPFLEIADDTCESVKYTVKAKNGKRVFSIKKIYIQGLGIYEFVLKIKCQNQSDKFSYDDLEKLYNAVEHTFNTREKIYSANERKIVRFLSGLVR